VSGLGAEVVSVAIFLGYALGSVWFGPGALFAVAALPYLVAAFAMRGKRETRERPDA
jgi:hypothetical protein